MAVETSSDDDDGVVEAMVNCKSSRLYIEISSDDDYGVIDALVNCKSRICLSV